jgi:hypothetical protein
MAAPHFSSLALQRELADLFDIEVRNAQAPSDSLSKLKSSSVRVSEFPSFTDAEMACIRLIFAEGTKLRADYWRVVKDGKERISSFDHRQKYALPAPLDAIAELQKELQDKRVTEAQLDTETGDLLFQFTINVN